MLNDADEGGRPMTETLTQGYALFTMGVLIYAFGVVYLADGVGQIRRMIAGAKPPERFGTHPHSPADPKTAATDHDSAPEPTPDSAGRAVLLGWSGFIMGIVGLLQGGALFSGELLNLMVALL